VRFLVDQDVYALTTRLLREWGHDVVTAPNLGLSRAADVELLAVARKQTRILVTRDKDYGALVFVDEKAGGVVLLRMMPSTVVAVHQQLKHVLESYSEAQMMSAFVVVEAGQHRFRRIPPTS
jgi:predicted nuclease of predicted toxin-antitoxin system